MEVRNSVDNGELEFNMLLWGTRELPVVTRDSITLPAQEEDFPIVALGGSAGSLDALIAFFQHVPADSPTAYLVATHLSPDYKSMLGDILGQHTRLPISVIEHGLRMEAGHIYVLPAGSLAYEQDGALYLASRENLPRLNMAIDGLFRSLALDQGVRVAGVILSGTGTDGWRGLTSVKARFGLTLTQPPASARYTEMPQRALQTDLVDYTLPPEEMPAAIADYFERARTYELPILRQLLLAEQPALRELFAAVGEKEQVDLSAFHRLKVARSVERRMETLKFTRVADYAAYTEAHPQEVDRLYKGLVIDIPTFFRNPKAYGSFEDALTHYLGNLAPDQPLHGWISGCVQGEESYTTAIVVQETLAKLGVPREVHLYATDLDIDALVIARTAAYPASIALDIAPELLARYFTARDNALLVKEEIRGLVSFSWHNLLRHYPYPELDFIVCRNVTSFFNGTARNRVLELMHYALKEDGILFLGVSDTIDHLTNLYAPLSEQWKIYRRLGTPQHEEIDVSLPVMPTIYGTRLKPYED